MTSAQTTSAPTTIAVLGHRGGIGRSAFAALLAGALAEDAKGVLLLDASALPGSSRLGDGGPEDPEPLSVSQRAVPPHSVLWAPGCLSGSGAAADARAKSASARAIVLDAPLCQRSELAAAVEHADLALVLCPADGPSLRSFAGFLEALRGERARPGRRFETRLVLRTPEQRSPESAKTAAAAREWMAAGMIDAEFAHDRRIAEAMAKGQSPAFLAAECPAAQQAAAIARTLLAEAAA